MQVSLSGTLGLVHKTGALLGKTNLSDDKMPQESCFPSTSRGDWFGLSWSSGLRKRSGIRTAVEID